MGNLFSVEYIPPSDLKPTNITNNNKKKLNNNNLTDPCIICSDQMFKNCQHRKININMTIKSIKKIYNDNSDKYDKQNTFFNLANQRLLYVTFIKFKDSIIKQLNKNYENIKVTTKSNLIDFRNIIIIINNYTKILEYYKKNINNQNINQYYNLINIINNLLNEFNINKNNKTKQIHQLNKTEKIKTIEAQNQLKKYINYIKNINIKNIKIRSSNSNTKIVKNKIDKIEKKISNQIIFNTSNNTTRSSNMIIDLFKVIANQQILVNAIEQYLVYFRRKYIPTLNYILSKTQNKKSNTNLNKPILNNNTKIQHLDNIKIVKQKFIIRFIDLILKVIVNKHFYPNYPNQNKNNVINKVIQTFKITDKNNKDKLKLFIYPQSLPDCSTFNDIAYILFKTSIKGNKNINHIPDKSTLLSQIDNITKNIDCPTFKHNFNNDIEFRNLSNMTKGIKNYNNDKEFQNLGKMAKGIENYNDEKNKQKQNYKNNLNEFHEQILSQTINQNDFKNKYNKLKTNKNK